MLITDLSPVTIGLLSILITILTYRLFSYFLQIRQLSLVIDRIPGPPVSSWLFGHLGLFWNKPKNVDWYQQIFQTFVGLTKVYQQDNGFMRLWIGPTQPVVIIFEAEYAEGLLTSNVNIDKSKEFDFVKQWLGLGLFTSTGDKWRVHRKMLTPAFHFRILESFVPIINKQQRVMLKIFEDQMDNNCVIDDVKPLIVNCGLDILCETAMGVSIEAQTDLDSTYHKAVQTVLELFTLRVLSPWLWNDYLFRLRPTGFKQRRTIKYLHNFTNKVIKRRKQEMVQSSNQIKSSSADSNKNVLAFLDNLLTVNMQQPEMLSLEDVRAEVDTFMSAGQETTSATLQFALQLIGHHPKVQEKIHEELDSIFSDDLLSDIRFEDLSKMKYLEKCIKETLRIYPPIMLIARNIQEEFKIKDQVIPVGTTCLVFFYQMHRDPKYFPNPEKFDPDRFSAFDGRHPFAYTPFSAGPRNCIGQRFGLQTTKAILASIFRAYRITSLVPMDRVQLAIGGTTLGPKSKITIKFDKRR